MAATMYAEVKPYLPWIITLGTIIIFHKLLGRTLKEVWSYFFGKELRALLRVEPSLRAMNVVGTLVVGGVVVILTIFADHFEMPNSGHDARPRTTMDLVVMLVQIGVAPFLVLLLVVCVLLSVVLCKKFDRDP